MKNLLRTLGSGAAFYVVMSACSAADTARTAGDGGVDEVADAFIDALANPVGDAKADPLPPDVATEPCNKSGFPTGAPSSVSLYAVHAYPGKTIEELSAVRTVVHATNPPWTIDGVAYNDYPGSMILHDGLVAVACGSPAAPASAAPVTFILPR